MHGRKMNHACSGSALVRGSSAARATLIYIGSGQQVEAGGQASKRVALSPTGRLEGLMQLPAGELRR